MSAEMSISDRLREVEAERERLLDEVRAQRRAAELGWGDLVRVACSATGRYLGKFDGVELALFVSAMDNSVNIDRVDRDREPATWNPPVPTDRELEAADNGLRYFISRPGGRR